MLTVIQYQNPILRQRSSAVKDIDQQFFDFLNDMVQTMFDSGGIGLAAPQVARSIRAMVISDGNKKVWKMINPELKSTNGSVSMTEGCLSIPGLYLPLDRPKKIVLEYQNEDGKFCREKFDGLVSRVIQHEIDHLDGKLIFDGLDPEKKRWLLNNLDTFKCSGVPIG